MKKLPALLILAIALPAAAAPPSMSTSILGLRITFDDCKSRVAAVLRERGYGRTYDTGNGYIGISNRFASSVSCIGNPAVLEVVVASNEGGDVEERDRILQRVRDGGSDEKPQSRGIGWSDNPNNLGLRGKSGRFTYTCPGGGSARATWGTGVYTDDSSICTAAVHSGVISTARGGSVTIDLLPGQASYTGSTRNGVTTTSYGPWNNSFSIVGGTIADREIGISTISWSDNARAWRGQDGERIRLRCPSGGDTSATVWGSRIYTDDSAICVAAVHAGEISAARGGEVTIEIRGGRGSYDSSTRNGISTRSYGSWDGSFLFVP